MIGPMQELARHHLGDASQFMEGAHTLTGDREGKWSLSVTANRRLTPRIHTAEHEIYDVNLEDYQ